YRVGGAGQQLVVTRLQFGEKRFAGAQLAARPEIPEFVEQGLEEQGGVRCRCQVSWAADTQLSAWRGGGTFELPSPRSMQGLLLGPASEGQAEDIWLALTQ